MLRATLGVLGQRRRFGFFKFLELAIPKRRRVALAAALERVFQLTL
jgi:hypothetical protein